jgi:hypothetical protein
MTFQLHGHTVPLVPGTGYGTVPGWYGTGIPVVYLVPWLVAREEGGPCQSQIPLRPSKPKSDDHHLLLVQNNK